MPAIELTPAARKEKRGEAHHLDPVVMIGADGLTPAILKETDAALKAHGLIKVRAFSDDRSTREAWLKQLADALGAAPVQHIGKLLVLWRPVPEKAAATTPTARGPGIRQVKVVNYGKSSKHRPTTATLTVFGNQRVTAGGQVKRAKKLQSSVKKRSLQER